MTSLLGAALATLITLAMFSRAYGDTRAFRWVSHLLLGMGAGYVASVVLKQVLLPALNPNTAFHPLQLGLSLIAGILIVLLGLRLSTKPGLRTWGLLPMGLMGGVGGALMLAGAVRGTLLPQLLAPLHLSRAFFPEFPALDTIAVIVATLTTLGVFFFLLPKRPTERAARDSLAQWLFDGWRLWGYWAWMLALGALLASTAGARITLLIDRVQWLLGLWIG